MTNILIYRATQTETVLSRFTLKYNIGFLFSQAAQIMFGLIHSALGMLWVFLYNLEEEQYSVGTVGMTVIIFYMLVSGSFVSKLWHC